MKYSREIKEFLGFVRKGLPLTISIILIAIVVAVLFSVLPVLAYIIGTGIALLFGTAAFGIIKDIADND